MQCLCNRQPGGLREPPLALYSDEITAQFSRILPAEAAEIGEHAFFVRRGLFG